MINKYKNIQGGYSDTRLWPCYFFYFGSILGLSPLFGGAKTFLVISIPTFYITWRIAAGQEKAWRAALSHAEREKIDLGPDPLAALEKIAAEQSKSSKAKASITRPKLSLAFLNKPRPRQAFPTSPCGLDAREAF